jgi:hypothetical protein
MPAAVNPRRWTALAVIALAQFMSWPWVSGTAHPVRSYAPGNWP